MNEIFCIIIVVPFRGLEMRFEELKNIVKFEATKKNHFQESSDEIEKIIFNLNKKEFIPLVSEIGTIPEDIEHDSTEEKLYTKVSDIILAKCFMELGLKSEVLRERANCADVVAKSRYHNYSLIGDAKAFRLSRTAKNQKDFKVECMENWRGSNDYSILCCPYFQYPKRKSQIYAQALQCNVLLFSWEYFSILLEKGITETPDFNLSNLWNLNSAIAKATTVQNMEKCFLKKQNNYITTFFEISEEELSLVFEKYKKNLVIRGELEVKYWENKILEIRQYTKEKAISELLKSLKLDNKIISINKFISNLRNNSDYR